MAATFAHDDDTTYCAGCAGRAWTHTCIDGDSTGDAYLDTLVESIGTGASAARLAAKLGWDDTGLPTREV
jgi:hypothetical protein